MEVLIQMLERVKRLDANKVIYSILNNRELQEWILDLNRKDQLFEKSINSLGVSLAEIGGGYAPMTEMLAGGLSYEYKGSVKFKFTGGAPFLYESGDFYASFVFRLQKDGFEIDANPVKEDTNLFVEWGQDILGLTSESMEKLVNLLIPVVQQKILRYIADNEPI